MANFFILMAKFTIGLCVLIKDNILNYEHL